MPIVSWVTNPATSWSLSPSSKAKLYRAQYAVYAAYGELPGGTLPPGSGEGECVMNEEDKAIAILAGKHICYGCDRAFADLEMLHFISGRQPLCMLCYISEISDNSECRPGAPWHEEA